MAKSITSDARHVPWSRSSVIHPPKAPGTHAATRPVPGTSASPIARTRSIVAAEPRRDRGVERVAPALEHGHPGLAGEPVSRAAHAERAFDLGPRRESHLSTR